MSWRGDKDEVRQMVTKVVNEWGKIDILVNNAGGSLHVPAEEITEEQWDKVTDLNLKPDFRQSGMHRFVKELIGTAFTAIGESQVKAAFFCSREVGKKRSIRSIGGNAISHLLFADSGGC